jgi:threonine dehydrogenase-like Zn-dependent dehydrogenase
MRRAVTLAPHAIELRDGPEPDGHPGQAILRVEAVGLCGSDYHVFDGTHPYAHYPRTQGHEITALIGSLPCGYSGHLRAGDRVAVEPLVSCGTCFPCRRGRYNCCVRLSVLGVQVDGGLAEQLAVDPAQLYPTGPLGPLAAVLTEPVSIGLHAVRRGMIMPGDQVVVLGAGTIGQAITLAATDRGARVLVADRVRKRLDRALMMGAERVVDSTRTDVPAAVARFTAGEGAAVVLEATGHAPMLRLAVEIAAHSGTVVAVGTSTAAVEIPVVEFSRKEISVIGSRNSAGIFGDAVAMVSRYADRLSALVTHQFELGDIGMAMSVGQGNLDAVGKVVVRVAGSP